MSSLAKDLLDVLHQSILTNLERQFEAVKEHFEEHPLFVMFEPKLNCNPKTDHLLPKNVYPLFADMLTRVQGKLAVELTLDANSSIDRFLTYSTTERVDSSEMEAEVEQLRKLLTQTKRDQLEQTRQFGQEKTKLINELKDIKEQIYIMSRSGMCYSPDFLGEYFAQAGKDGKVQAKVKVEREEAATKEQNRISAMKLPEKEPQEEPATEPSELISNNEAEEPACAQTTEEAAVNELDEQREQFDAAVEYRERMLEFEQHAKDAVENLKEAEEENKQLSREIAQAKQLVQMMREKLTNKEWNELVEQEQLLIENSAEKNECNFIRELSMHDLLEREAPPHIKLDLARHPKKDADISIPVEKLLGTAPEMMDYASIASLQARHKVLKAEAERLQKAHTQKSKEYDAILEKLHDLQVINGDNEEKLRLLAGKSKKSGRGSRSESEIKTEPQSSERAIDKAYLKSPRSQTVQSATNTSVDLTTTIEQLVASGIRLQALTQFDDTFETADGLLRISTDQMRLLQRFCDIQQKKQNVLSPIMPEQLPRAEKALTQEEIERSSAFEDVSLADEVSISEETCSEHEDKSAIAEGESNSRNRYLSENAVNLENCTGSTVSALMQTQCKCADIDELVSAPSEPPIAPPSEPPIAPPSSRRNAEIGQNDEFLFALGFEAGEPSIEQFLADNNMTEEDLEALRHVVQNLRAGQAFELVAKDQELEQFDTENGTLERGIEVLNEIHDIAQRSVDVANAACQCGGDAENLRIDESEARNIVDYKIGQHIRAREPTQNSDSVFKNYYYDVPGQNVYEKLFNAAKILRQREEDRIIEYVKEQEFYQLGKLQEKLSQQRVFGETFFHTADTVQKSTPRIIQENLLVFQNSDVQQQKSVLRRHSDQLDVDIEEHLIRIEKLKHTSPVAERPILTFQDLERQWNSHIDESKVLYLEEVGLTQDSITKRELEYLMNLPGDQFKNVVKPMVMEKPQEFEGYMNKSLGINRRRSSSTIAASSCGKMVESVEIGQELPQLSKTLAVSFPRKAMNSLLTRQYVFQQGKQ